MGLSAIPGIGNDYRGVEMTIRAFFRGHAVIYLDDEGEWLYEDTLESIAKAEERTCAKCGRFPTPEGYDACLGYLPGVGSACCGHGKAKAFAF